MSFSLAATAIALAWPPRTMNDNMPPKRTFAYTPAMPGIARQAG